MSTERRNTQNEEAEDALGVLDSTGAIGTADIGLLGESTAQVPVALPVPDDDDLVDDDVTDGEAFADLVLDADPADLVRGDDGIGRIHQGAGISDIVIEIPAVAAEEVVVAELVEDATARDHDVAGGVEGDASGSADPSPQAAASDEPAVQEDAPAEEAAVEDVAAEETVVDPIDDQVDAPDFDTAFDGTAFDGIAEDVNAGEVEFPVDDDAEAVEVGEHAEPVADVEAEEDTGAVADHESSVEPVVASVVPAELVLHAVDGTSPAPVRALDVNTAPTVAAAATEEEEIMTDDHARASDPDLTSRRLDQLGDRERESADLLTADRLLDASRLAGPEPEGLWSHLLYTVSGRRINLGDGKRAQQRKALSARIASPLSGTARFVPVLSRKGGVGKTTVTALLGMALADAREDRVIAVDANPDRGTLADRIARTNGKTVRDLVRIHDQVTGYHDISAVVSRDATRLDVLASDADPRVSEAFNDEDYDQVASVAAHYYSLVLTDTGTGIVHSVMGAILDRADTLVIVAGLSVDEARLASETLTWLEANGYAAKVRDAVVVLNQSTPGSPMVRLGELEAHFRTRVAHVLRLPYDARIAAGSAITFAALQPETRQAARELAAIVVEGLRAQAA